MSLGGFGGICNFKIYICAFYVFIFYMWMSWWKWCGILWKPLLSTPYCPRSRQLQSSSLGACSRRGRWCRGIAGYILLKMCSEVLLLYCKCCFFFFFLYSVIQEVQKCGSCPNNLSPPSCTSRNGSVAIVAVVLNLDLGPFPPRICKWHAAFLCSLVYLFLARMLMCVCVCVFPFSSCLFCSSC